MGKFIDKLLRNPFTFEITSIFVYIFYCLVFAVAAIPSALLIRWAYLFINNIENQDYEILLFLAFVAVCAVSCYIFLIATAIFVGFVERLLTIGLKPGAYPVGSPEFFKWLVYSGLHLWMVNLVLGYLRGNNWIKIYLRISGAKIGKGVFINTKDIYDAYMLEIGNDVIIGGEANINCHLHEGINLHLGKIKIGDGTVIAGRAYLTPGTRTGKNSKIGIQTYVRRNTEAGDGESLISMPAMNIRAVMKLMKLMQANQKEDKKEEDENK